MDWSTEIILAAVALVVAALAGALLWWFWWGLPKRQVYRLRISDPKARADVEDNFRKSVGQILVGIAAALIASFFAYIQFLQQQQQALVQRQVAQAQSAASRDMIISNQLAKGLEDLGNDRIVLRLGGIYLLEAVMNGSFQYHQPVVETLSAFVRDASREYTGNGPPPIDVQAALRAIGRRAAVGTTVPDLSNAHIPRADLRNADLRDTDLGGTDLGGANLGSANLTHSVLPDANLSHAYLVDANLIGADMTGANLTGAYLKNADLRGAKVTQAQLDQACGRDAKLDPGLTLRPC